MNYAMTVRESQQEVRPTRNVESQSRPMQEIIKRKVTQVDIVCLSPRTGTTYPTTVTLPSDTPGISAVEGGTSESSRRLRKEAKEIYKEVFQEAKGKSTRECGDDRDVDRVKKV